MLPPRIALAVLRCAPLVGLLLFGGAAAHSDVRYVDDDAAAKGDGLKWTTAYRYLQDALAEAAADPAISEIRVAAGVQMPDRDEAGGVTEGDRLATFALRDGLQVRGGYRGLSGGGSPDDRDTTLFESVLSGDLDGDDGPWFARNTENSCVIVTAWLNDATAVLDGFTIMGGNADVYDSPAGAGVACLGASPTIIDCTFVSCEASTYGGGVYAMGELIIDDEFYTFPCTPVLLGCRFDGCRASEGGAVCCHLASATMIDCLFTGNTARNDGGAVRLKFQSIDSVPSVLINCAFHGNTGLDGGALADDHNEADLVNCVFSGNSASHRGGALYAGAVFHADDYFTLINCTVVANRADDYTGGIYSASVRGVKLGNCIFWANEHPDGSDEAAQVFNGGPIVNYSCIQGWTGGLGGTGNTGADPLLIDSDGPDGVLGTDDDNPRLRPTSPCIDAADNTELPADTFDLDQDGDTAESLPVDLDYEPRVVDDPNVPDTGNPPGAPAHVDMGAYEGARRAFIIAGTPVTVPEGETAEFTVALAQDPQGELTVTVARQGGDADITIVSGETLVFNPDNYAEPQPVVLAAAQDADVTSDTASFLVSAPGVHATDVTATEADDDPVPARLYVDADASGLNTGLSWTDAYNELRDALETAAEHAEVGEIWVARGTYSPAPPGGDRRDAFQLLNGLTVYGGFAAGDTDPAQRDSVTNETILSGDLDGDDPEFSDCCVGNGEAGCEDAPCRDMVCMQDPYCCAVEWDATCALLARLLCRDLCGTRTDNSFHVVTTGGTDPSAVLDGFTITGGYSDEFGNRYGGGLYNYEGSPTLVNLTFLTSMASFGGGMYTAANSSPTLVNCRFISNASDSGGGLASTYGGGEPEQSNPELANCAFVGNYSTGIGSGLPVLGNGGGIWSSGRATLANCTFFSNRGLRAAGLWDEGPGNDQYHATVTNCVFWGNVVGDVADEDAQLESWYGVIDVNYTCVQGWTGALGGVGNIGDDPRFIDPLGPDGEAGTADDNLRLLSGSPCIDAADNDALPEGIDTDLDGNPRFVDDRCADDTGNGDPPIVDMGAYEYQPCPGDLNCDGDTDQSDLGILLADWGCAGGDCPGDCDGDGDTDQSDLGILLTAWGCGT